MFRNWLSAAWGDLKRSPVQSLIVVGGLSIGLAAVLIIGLIEFGIFNYDDFVPERERLYLIALDTHDTHGDQLLASTPHELSRYLGKIPEVEAVARTAGGVEGSTILVRQGKVTAQQRMNWADPAFFRIYRAPVLYGNLDTALDRPDGAVLNLSTARKYFGQDDVVGRTVGIDKNYSVTVRAVIADLPHNSTYRAGLFLSSLSSHSLMSTMADKPAMSREKGFSAEVFTLVRLRRGASVESLDRRGSAIVAPFVAPPFHAEMRFLPLRKALLTVAKRVGTILLLFTSVALVILALSCINFVNLSIARSAQRAVEVSIRKTCGAGRPVLIAQFLSESVLQASLAFVLASAILEWTRPALSAYFETDIPDYWRDPILLTAVLGGTVLVGLVAGLYPAFILSGFRPAAVLKGWIITSLQRGRLMAGLVSFQFAAMAVFLIAAGVMFQQNAYQRHDPHRAPIHDTLLIHTDKCETVLEDQIARLRGVRGVTCSSGGVLNEGPTSVGAKRKDGRIIQVQYASVGLNFFEFYGRKPLVGRLFRPGDAPTERLMNVVIDETAVRQLGFGTAEAAVGQSIDFQNTHRAVIGVVENFYIVQPTQGSAPPMIYSLTFPQGPTGSAIHVRIEQARAAEIRTATERIWRESGAQSPVSEQSLDQLVQRAEDDSLTFGKMFTFVAGGAMLLGCLGLFGISLLTSQRRIKEIGVRKAMGARARDIVWLLLWQFAQPVVWANVFAWPVAFWAMNRWLSGFVYHAAMPFWLFPAVGAATLIIALATVVGQSWLVARQKPVLALRYE